MWDGRRKALHAWKENPVFSMQAGFALLLRRLDGSRSRKTHCEDSSIAARDPVSLQRIAQFALLRTAFAPGATSPRARTHRKKPMDDLGAMNYSLTLLEQEECESVCARFLIGDFLTVPASQLTQMRREGLLDEENRPRLMREKHVQYLRKGLAGLSGGFVATALEVAAVARLLDYSCFRSVGGSGRG